MIGAYSSIGSHYEIPGQRQKLASFPIPVNGSTTAKKDSDLMWREALAAEEYRVYFGTDKIQVENALEPEAIYKAQPPSFLNNSTETLAGIRTSDNIYNPGQLLPGQRYYWRVDIVSNGEIRKGVVWEFTVEL